MTEWGEVLRRFRRPALPPTPPPPQAKSGGRAKGGNVFGGAAAAAGAAMASGGSGMEEILADGCITLEEFGSIMKGEISGRDPLEEVRAVFAALCRAAPDERPENLQRVTFGKLKAASRDFDVKLSDGELRMMIEEADQDGGGAVDEREFIGIMNLSAWF